MTDPERPQQTGAQQGGDGAVAGGAITLGEGGLGETAAQDPPLEYPWLVR